MDEGRAWLSDADVLVDRFGHGSYTDFAAQGMGHGCVVISRIDPKAGSALQEICPVIDSAPDLVGDVVSDLAGNDDRLIRLSQDATAYARNNHNGTLSGQIVAKTFGWTAEPS
jgi:hypothetical protein